MRGIKDSEQGNVRSVMSEWIQLSFTLSPLQLRSFLVSVPLPPGSRPVHGRMDGRADTHRPGWTNDGQMERGASRVKAADKSERGNGSSSEVATASPPGPKREPGRDNTLPLSFIDPTDYHCIKSFLRQHITHSNFRKGVQTWYIWQHNKRISKHFSIIRCITMWI